VAHTHPNHRITAGEDDRLGRNEQCEVPSKDKDKYGWVSQSQNGRPRRNVGCESFTGMVPQESIVWKLANQSCTGLRWA
jgi:hypothetical protein